jgi:hypothetical protein
VRLEVVLALDLVLDLVLLVPLRLGLLLPQVLLVLLGLVLVLLVQALPEVLLVVLGLLVLVLGLFQQHLHRWVQAHYLLRSPRLLPLPLCLLLVVGLDLVELEPVPVLALRG